MFNPPQRPELVAAAQEDYDLARDHLAALVDHVVSRLDEGVDDLYAIVDVWLSLRIGSQAFSSFVSAIAIVQLAQCQRRGLRRPLTALVGPPVAKPCRLGQSPTGLDVPAAAEPGRREGCPAEPHTVDQHGGSAGPLSASTGHAIRPGGEGSSQ